jgi:hypothetical protein
LKQDIEACQAPIRKKGLEGQLRSQQEKLREANEKLTKYDEKKKKENEATSDNSSQSTANNTSQQTSNGSGTHNFKGCPPQRYVSEVIATFPGGIKRQATGLTIRAVRK